MKKEQRVSIRKEVGRLLNDLRVAQRKKRPAIAREIGVSTQAVDAWESGKACVSLQCFDKAAEAYGMTKEEKEKISGMIFSNGARQSSVRQEKLSEQDIFAGFVSLPIDSRRRILAAMVAYDKG